MILLGKMGSTVSFPIRLYSVLFVGHKANSAGLDQIPQNVSFLSCFVMLSCTSVC